MKEFWSLIAVLVLVAGVYGVAQLTGSSSGDDLFAGLDDDATPPDSSKSDTPRDAGPTGNEPRNVSNPSQGAAPGDHASGDSPSGTGTAISDGSSHVDTTSENPTEETSTEESSTEEVASQPEDTDEEPTGLAALLEKYGNRKGDTATTATTGEEDTATETGDTRNDAEAPADALAHAPVEVRGAGKKSDPYIVPWDVLIAAQETYQPRQGKEKIPDFINALNGTWVKITGFVAFPLMVPEADQILLMLNQWDGCCVGVPPSPYDGIEVELQEAVAGESGINVFHYGTVTGRFTVEPYIVNNWLVGLYMMDDATLELEM